VPSPLPNGEHCGPEQIVVPWKESPMLVLSRQRDESIIIGDNIVITIVDIRGDKVRLGINAPTEIPVHRQEVYEAIQRENLRAGRLEPKDVRNVGRDVK
jgi:carbon storage regulator